MAAQLLKVKDVAERLNVSTSWVYRRTRMTGLDRLPYKKVGKYIRFDPAEIEEWLQGPAVYNLLSYARAGDER